MNTVAYFGIPGSYSYAVALNYFNDNNAEFLASKRFKDVFDAVQTEKALYGVIPIENSLAGSVYENYGLLSESSLHIVGEAYLKIEHCLLGMSGQGFVLGAIKKVFAHPQALAQCSQFFEKNPTIEQVPYGDNASAAEFVAQQKDNSLAAIACEGAAEVYNLAILMKDIANSCVNYTRFLVIGRSAIEEGTNKCSVAFNLPHVAGSLSNALKILSDSGMNLTKIESRPLFDKPFEYIFYLDMEFSEKYQRGVIGNQFRKAVENLKVLGIYKSADSDLGKIIL